MTEVTFRLDFGLSKPFCLKFSSIRWIKLLARARSISSGNILDKNFCHWSILLSHFHNHSRQFRLLTTFLKSHSWDCKRDADKAECYYKKYFFHRYKVYWNSGLLWLFMYRDTSYNSEGAFLKMLSYKRRTINMLWTEI